MGSLRCQLRNAPLTSPNRESPSIQSRKAFWRPMSALAWRVAHSHTHSTRQSSALSVSITRRSRYTLASSLSFQQSGRVAGSFAYRRSWYVCQKQPWTTMATIRPGITMSGVPGKSRRCKRNRYPNANSNRRTSSSGREFLPLMPAIIRLRSSGDTQSTTRFSWEAAC